uniref:uncharacterized protein LOC101304559 n=1 Tax=Fragaria vesca subsp. vesca TaxID=101020 RepID=UPI0005CA8BB8|nr:PREDICTED: uncharacterized protein LOC101304559 [Fragaria vesca subsp. vesca]
MQDRLKERMEAASQFNVVYSTTNIYEVRGKYSHVVDLSICSCTCRKWEIECFPCSHALAAIQAASKDVYAFVDPHYFADYYKKCYDVPFFPLCNADMASAESTNDEFIHPPHVKRPLGRPKKKRFKSNGETQKELIRCGRCQKLGNHNKDILLTPVGPSTDPSRDQLSD